MNELFKVLLTFFKFLCEHQFSLSNLDLNNPGPFELSSLSKGTPVINPEPVKLWI